MLFNPLFLQVINNQESVSAKAQKLSNPSYLFSDIIKVSFENEMQDSTGKGTLKTDYAYNSQTDPSANKIINIPIELKSANLANVSVENILGKLVTQMVPNVSNDALQKSGLTKEFLKSAEQGSDGSKLFFNQEKVCDLISGLVNNKEFNGKANLVIDRQKLMQDNYSSALDEITKNEITPETILDLLKMGNKISLESNPSDKNLGLMITLIEQNNEADTSDQVGSGSSANYGLTNLFKNNSKDLTGKDLLEKLQNMSSAGMPVYEVKINVIEQSANIDQNSNFSVNSIDINREPENKFNIDIVLKDSAGENSNGTLSMLGKIAPPETLFASNSMSAGELNKFSSSFSNSLAFNAQQLKNISQLSNNNPADTSGQAEINLSGVSIPAADGKAVSGEETLQNPQTESKAAYNAAQEISSNTKNNNAASGISFQNDPDIKESAVNQKAAGDILNSGTGVSNQSASVNDFKTFGLNKAFQTAQNNIPGKTAENNPGYVKLSDSIKTTYSGNNSGNPVEKMTNPDGSVQANMSLNGKQSTASENSITSKTLTGKTVNTETSFQSEASAIKEETVIPENGNTADGKPLVTKEQNINQDTINKAEIRIEDNSNPEKPLQADTKINKEQAAAQTDTNVKNTKAETKSEDIQNSRFVVEEPGQPGKAKAEFTPNINTGTADKQVNTKSTVPEEAVNNIEIPVEKNTVSEKPLQAEAGKDTKQPSAQKTNDSTEKIELKDQKTAVNDKNTTVKTEQENKPVVENKPNVENKPIVESKTYSDNKPAEDSKAEINNKNSAAAVEGKNKLKDSNNEQVINDQSKIASNEKINTSDQKKDLTENVNQQAPKDIPSQESKKESADTQAKNDNTAKTEIADSAKAGSGNGKETNTEDNKKQDKSLADSNSEEHKKAQESKSVNEANFNKTFETITKDKTGLEKGSYSDTARVVKAAEVAKEISKHIQAKENGTIYLKIDPEHLGAVKIAVEVVDKVVKANIEVENESARKLIETNLNQLYNNLNQNGVQLNALNISLANHEQQKQGKAFSSRKQGSGYGEDGNDNENNDISKEKNLGYNTYEYTV